MHPLVLHPLTAGFLLQTNFTQSKAKHGWDSVSSEQVLFQYTTLYKLHCQENVTFQDRNSISGNAKISANTSTTTEDDAAFKGVREAKLLLLMMHLHFSDLFHVSTKMPPPPGSCNQPLGLRSRWGAIVGIKHKIKIQTNSGQIYLSCCYPCISQPLPLGNE